MNTFRLLSLSAVVATGLLISGCQPAGTATKSDGGLSEAVSQLGDLYKTIKDGLEAGDDAGNSAAHVALHEVGGPLQKLASMGSESGLEAADREKVHAAAEAMAESFGKIDELQHSGGEIDYAEFSEPLQAAFDTLKSFCK